MTTTKLNLDICSGATFQRTITWKGSDGTTVDLTGYAARMHLRRSVQSRTTVAVLSTLSEEGGGITVDLTKNQFLISLTPQFTAALPAGAFVYDFETVSPSGDVVRLLSGSVTIVPEVTRSQ